MQHKVCLIHPFDPRGNKVGGLETYVRDFITFHPEDLDLLVVGVDGTGDLELGSIVPLEFRGRRYNFMPILSYPENEMHEAARRLTASITFRFFWALAKYFWPLRSRLHEGKWSVELRRMEFAVFPWLWRLPFIQMLHGEGAPHQKMDSLLRKYWFVQRINERFAVSRAAKFLCVNPNITVRVREEYPKFKSKVDTLTTWANTRFYQLQSSRTDDGVFRIVFCGRLDHFKMPPLMFKAVDGLRARLGGGVAFHYVGASDPARFPEFERIRNISVLHGFQDAAGIARILGQIDVGILTSEFEGMPRFVLETLRSGRPVVSIHLPQLEEVIEDGVSGYLVPRLANEADQVDALVDRLVAIRSEILDRRLDPARISQKTDNFTPQRLLGRVYQYHRDIHNGIRWTEAEARSESRQICLIHPMDPRGQKVGGIETHLRLMLRYAPAGWRVLFVGVDSRGDCKLGQAVSLDMDGRKFDFLPVCFYAEDRVHGAAKTIGNSITFQFALGLLRYLPKIRQAVAKLPTSIELQRFEFAVLPRLLGRPAVQIIHGEGSKGDKMDSLIKRYWFVHRTNEEIAIRLANSIVCVNPNIMRRLREKLGDDQRIVCMPVSVDTAIFGQAGFNLTDGIFRVMFAGRLDEFKDPPTMFKVLAEVHRHLRGAFEFHYVGTSDPQRYAEARLIEAFTIRHGYRTAPEVAKIAAHCHAGVLTSFFEGMPCYLLEMLAVGRPVIAIRLPQYDAVIVEGVSGYLVERVADEETLVALLAERFVHAWSAIREGAIDPAMVRSKAMQFSVEAQLDDHFARHAALEAGRFVAGSKTPAAWSQSSSGDAGVSTPAQPVIPSNAAVETVDDR
ncbi:glycosyltransferase involved in cell wall biosynthesis [Bradyrhizobium sp. USDA 4449]